ncbi:hypothetical protein G3545_14120 [Starkeya sp. ORNL1]|uniref:head-tail joining protein n=1 Tax=Starkeya sp. ORNL1 TaxID=2709380 RepID=UPI00146488E4|nr:hypothetical protein [Starkeya sp. ORNL1]QJP14679.1 hypothetical protein G3545_14120 [Starkeya sp. ORNL1]
MGVYDEQVDVYFRDAHLPHDALYKAGGVGAGVACRVITRQPDELTEFGGTQLVRATTLVDVRIAEVAAPREGDSFVVGATTYTVAGAPRRDAERLVWTCGCRGT